MIYLLAGQCEQCGEPLFSPALNRFVIIRGCVCGDMDRVTGIFMKHLLTRITRKEMKSWELNHLTSGIKAEDLSA